MVFLPINKFIRRKLYALLFAQLFISSYSVYWLFKYYSKTLIPTLIPGGYKDIYNALGGIGKFSLAICVLLLFIFFIYFLISKKRDINVFLVLLYLLFLIPIFLLIVSRVTDFYMLHESLAIVARTYIWVNLLVLAIVNIIGLLITILLFAIFSDLYQ